MKFAQSVSIHPYFKVNQGQLEDLKEPLAHLGPEWFVFETGVDR